MVSIWWFLKLVRYASSFRSEYCRHVLSGGLRDGMIRVELAKKPIRKRWRPSWRQIPSNNEAFSCYTLLIRCKCCEWLAGKIYIKGAENWHAEIKDWRHVESNYCPAQLSHITYSKCFFLFLLHNKGAKDGFHDRGLFNLKFEKFPIRDSIARKIAIYKMWSFSLRLDPPQCGAVGWHPTILNFQPGGVKLSFAGPLSDGC